MDVPVAVVLRLIAIFDVGYIHPDEFFQSPEVMGKEILGYETHIPWEYSCQNDGKLYRSIVSPYISSGFAFWLFHKLGWDTSGYAVFLAPRIVLFALSLIVDYLVWALFGQRVYYVYRTSWVTMVLMTRPTSNTLEAYFLIACFFFAHRRYLTMLGMFSAFGVFNRITFPAFVLPVILHGILQEDMFTVGKITKRGFSPGRVGGVILGLVRIGIGFVAGCLFHILMDSAYAERTPACTDAMLTFESRSFVLTPLNNLEYNSDVQNLAKHGIHQRSNHVLVNMQILFSPIWIFSLLGGSAPLHLERRVIRTLKAISFFGLLVLSAAPHQEARFLIPLVLPISVLTADTITQNNKIRHMWKTFNIVAGVFFGFFHQGGVVRSLMALEHDVLPNAQGPICIATYETYMGPRFLLANRTHDVASFLDLNGMEPAGVRNTLLAVPECKDAKWYMILPATAVADFNGDIGESTRIDTYWPHFTGERPANTIWGLSLELHKWKPT